MEFNLFHAFVFMIGMSALAGIAWVVRRLLDEGRRERERERRVQEAIERLEALARELDQKR
ncbi:MAG: hypothetical protein AB7J30_12535 [Hyphomicrobium sp.]|uniref:hypothetical protein n=1 Tax=Hyphomicrobium sp. TaxID=82 RepID=UPI003D0A91DC